MSGHSISDIHLAQPKGCCFRTLARLLAGALAALPFAVAIAGLLRGGIEPYIVLAALALG